VSTRRAVALARRFALVLAVALLGTATLAAGTGEYEPVMPGREFEWPRDFGAHPAYRTEWWYATGWLKTADGRDLGFQVTFFRVRPRVGENNPSRFALRQIHFAHAALADPQRGALRHAERSARAVFDLVGAKEGTTDVWIDDWSLKREAESYRARIPAGDFNLDLILTPTQPVLMQGEGGFFQKTPNPRVASYYYSEPHLRVTGSVERDGRRETVTGSAWLDHEWFSEKLPEEAVGWDWTGLNLADGSALMAFRLRDAAGATVWASGTLRRNDGTAVRLGRQEVAFEPLRQWRSPRTGVTFPVAMALRAGPLSLRLEPMFDDQELDARRSVGAIYWEGAVRALQDGRELGRGYMELTGYGKKLAM
jgi:predicted secreted hydrolase